MYIAALRTVQSTLRYRPKQEDFIYYISRALAITYLNKTELAQVTEEDLQPDAVRRDTVDTAEYAEEEVHSERTLTLDAKPAPTPAALRPAALHPVSPHIQGAATP